MLTFSVTEIVSRNLALSWHSCLCKFLWGCTGLKTWVERRFKVYVLLWFQLQCSLGTNFSVQKAGQILQGLSERKKETQTYKVSHRTSPLFPPSVFLCGLQSFTKETCEVGLWTLRNPLELIQRIEVFWRWMHTYSCFCVPCFSSEDSLSPWTNLVHPTSFLTAWICTSFLGSPHLSPQYLAHDSYFRMKICFSCLYSQKCCLACCKCTLNFE